MNIQKILCVLMALLLAFTIVAQPLEVKAVDPVTAAVVGIPLIAAVSAIIVACGVLPGSNSSSFSSLASTIGDALSASWKFTSAAGTAMLKLVCLGNKYYVAQEVFDFVLSMIHSSGAVDETQAASVPSGAPEIFNKIFSTMNAYSSGYSHYLINTASSWAYTGLFLKSAPIFTTESGRLYCTYTCYKIIRFYSDGSVRDSTSYSSGYTQKTDVTDAEYWWGAFSTVYTSDIYGVDGLADSLSSDVYDSWTGAAVADTDDNDYLPITVPGTVTPDFGQGDAQDGSGSDTGDEEDTGETVIFPPATLPGDDTVPDETLDITEPGADSGSDTGSGSGAGLDYTSWFEKIVGWFDKVHTSIDAGFASVGEWISSKADSISTAVTTGISNVGSWISAQTEALTIQLGKIGEWIGEQTTALGDAIASGTTAILEGIKALFVPSEAFVAAKVDALRAQFGFVDSILVTLDAMKAGLSSGGSGKAPVIYVHLGNSEGSINWGGTVKFLDLTWYSRYKASGDAILSGFLWACFLWRVFMRLPGIINGVGGFAGFVSKSVGGDDE